MRLCFFFFFFQNYHGGRNAFTAWTICSFVRPTNMQCVQIAVGSCRASRCFLHLGFFNLICYLLIHMGTLRTIIHRQVIIIIKISIRSATQVCMSMLPKVKNATKLCALIQNSNANPPTSFESPIFSAEFCPISKKWASEPAEWV